MGIPISIDDPINGGCDTCIPFVPLTLDATYQVFAGGFYSGQIIFDSEPLNRWQGILTSPLLPVKAFLIRFCDGPEGRMLLSFGIEPTWTEDSFHCDLPFESTNPNTGGIATVSIP